MTVGIVTDSAASLPAELAASCGVTVVPLHLNLGSESFLDGEVPLDTVIARLDEGLQTSGPSPGEFAAAIEAADARDGVLVCTIASGMSSTYDAARLASQLAEGSGVELLDTGTAAGAEGIVVLAAAAAAAGGAALDDVAAAARRAADDVRLVATLPTLDHLARSGRVPGIAAQAGRWLGLAPVFEFKGGHARPHRPARGVDAAFEKMLGYCRDGAGHGGRLHVAAMHADDPAAADRLLDAVRAELDVASAWVGSFSTVMVAHTGPGLAGLAWWWEPAVA